jgi:hypothetical protein
MATNTNDCFVGFSAVKLKNGFVLWGPGYDAGTEWNDELCDSIPGPACGGINNNNGGGEGRIHIHRGVHGIADLDEAMHDWRNPMLQIVVASV